MRLYGVFLRFDPDKFQICLIVIKTPNCLMKAI